MNQLATQLWNDHILFNDLIIQLATQLWYDHILSDDVIISTNWAIVRKKTKTKKKKKKNLLSYVLGASARKKDLFPPL